MLAVLIRLLKGWAGAVGRDALAAKSYRNVVGIRVGALHLSGSVGFVDRNVLDDFALFVVEATQEGACAQQAPETAI